MKDGRGRSRHPLFETLVPLAAAMAAAAGVSCQRPGATAASSSSETTLRIGVPQLSLTAPFAGLRQLSQLLTVESLARTRQDGRMEPVLAEAWTMSDEGRVLSIKLRPGVTFTDGSPFDASVAATILPAAVRATLGPFSEAIESIDASNTDTV